MIIFLSKNHNNLIVAFDEHPQAYQLKFYLNKITVKDIRKKQDFIALIDADKSFKYFITRKDTKIDELLEKHLKENYKRKRIDDYTVYLLRQS